MGWGELKDRVKLDNLPATRPGPQPSTAREAATPHLASRGQQTPGLWHPEVVCPLIWHCVARLRSAKGRPGPCEWQGQVNVLTSEPLCARE